MAGLLFGVGLSALFAIAGYLIAYRKYYGLIAGYNTASESEKREYDIEPLSRHLGDGLIVIGVPLTISSVLFWLGFDLWSTGVMGVFVFMVFILLIGTRKYLPARMKRARKSGADARH
jgi:membrane glycosyltransferase